MNDTECVDFLQWCLPRMEMRWPGFRRVRRQVCKRLRRRMTALGLGELGQYRAYLEAHADEWRVLDGLCHISISRFYRDRAVFDHLGSEILPRLADLAAGRGDAVVRLWSAGCASGEEAYTLSMVWRIRVLPRRPRPAVAVLATDADETLLARARAGCYGAGSLEELPAGWRETAFVIEDGQHCVAPAYRQPVSFRLEDLRRAMPEETFQLILCRNLAFTYFDEALQRRILARLLDRLSPGGVLVIGGHEVLPPGIAGLTPLGPGSAMFGKCQAGLPEPTGAPVWTAPG